MTILEDLLERAAAVLAPSRCALCDAAADEPACPSCTIELPWHEPEPGPDTSEPVPVLAAFRYADPVRSAVHRLKYGNRPDVVRPLTRLAAPALMPRVRAIPDLLVPVPLHPNRLAHRGFNQAALLASSFRRILDPRLRQARLLPRALERRVDTGQLVGADRTERSRRVSEAFALRQPSLVAGRTVLLVDDVVTTGSTARACAAVLRAGGASVLGVLALCATEASYRSGQ